MCNILIADGAESFCSALSEELQHKHRVCTCAGGREALESIRTFRPDVIILDLMLPEVDGFGLLQEARKIGLEPIILATVRFLSDYILTAAQMLGVDYLMQKPCDLKVVQDRLEELLQIKRKRDSGRIEERPCVSELLLMLSIPTHFKGFGYLNDAIELMLQSPEISVTKEMYPTVARSHGTTAAQVERGIRNAIQSGWKNGNKEQWKKYFPANASGEIMKPSNGIFISRIACVLKINPEYEMAM